MKTHVITICNWKGGVGKSTSAASIGEALSINGRRVLLFDLDAQQNLTFMFTHRDDFETSIYNSFVSEEPLPIIHIHENLDIVPASVELARVEIDLAAKMAREFTLKTLIESHLDDYDYILFDCPPLLGIVTTNALVASNKVYIPLTAEALPVKGLTMLDGVIGEVRRRVNPNLELGGVFVTRYCNNRKLNKEVVNKIKVRYGDKVFRTIIRENISLAEMPLASQSIFEYAPKSNGAIDYMSLTEEIIAREENR